MEKDSYYTAHEECIRHVVPLMIHYVWRRRHSASAPNLFEIFDRHVDIWRKTIHYDGGAAPSDVGFSHGAWSEIRNGLAACFVRYGQCGDSGDLERACLEYLWPLMEPRLYEDSRPVRKGEARPYGAWTVTFRENNVMSVHIANVYRPDSVFDHPAEFADDLLCITRDTCEQRPHLKTLFCGSWMNNLPPFQKFFPPEWIMNLHRPVYHNDTYGIWGQYVTRTGGFHHKNAAKMRERGVHPFPLIHAQCGIASVVSYLEGGGWHTQHS